LYDPPNLTARRRLLRIHAVNCVKGHITMKGITDFFLYKWLSLKAITEVTRAQLATGELFPQTADEFAAEMGIDADLILAIYRA
jgi:hypothetical protein